MLFFECDYNNGAHPAVLERLIDTNKDSQTGYGEDEYTAMASAKIKEFCHAPDAKVYLLNGGTQANLVVLTAILRPFEGVLSAVTGHIHAHEAGALENAGIKILPLQGDRGKVNYEELKRYLEKFYEDENREHMVFPGALYISHPTEYGTIYSKKELYELSALCKKYSIRLFLDGARLGYGLMSKKTDVTIDDIVHTCDVFYIGGTKVGALCGEAVVFPSGKMPDHFANHVKKLGAMLAKGRLLGVQFDALFTDDLYLKISEHAINMADELKKLLHRKQIRFFLETDTNQQFVIIQNDRLKELQKQVKVSYWEPYDDSNTVVRFATSWSTTTEDLMKLESIL